MISPTLGRVVMGESKNGVVNNIHTGASKIGFTNNRSTQGHISPVYSKYVKG